MARRMTLEGAKVLVVAELMPYSGGLKRNIVQCLNDFGIPLKLSHTVVNIEGKERVPASSSRPSGRKRRPIPGTEEHYDCDTLLLSCGLIPENELSRGMGVGAEPRDERAGRQREPRDVDPRRLCRRQRAACSRSGRLRERGSGRGRPCGRRLCGGRRNGRRRAARDRADRNFEGGPRYTVPVHESIPRTCGRQPDRALTASAA
jgi:hypothetical protein